MWIQWMHTYYIKGNTVWNTEPKNASWATQKIFKARNYFANAGLSEEDVQKMEKYSVKQLYKTMQGDFPKMTWRKLVYNNQGQPKWTFILRLAIQQRLSTKEKLARWGIIAEQTCSLCNKENETVQHLFFDCETTRKIWLRLLEWQGIRRPKKSWQEEVTWMAQISKGKSACATVCKMTLAAVVYHILQERNSVIFQKKTRTSNVILRLII
ncbi:uncharacterized protein LOC107820043 [Nicotiana tabacum]|uniref:uncharacterized protein LOC107820043 n=1 Tax=Nicotiana tabacum TaxID=4097 RepID=UPI003F4ECD2E